MLHLVGKGTLSWSVYVTVVYNVPENKLKKTQLADKPKKCGVHDGR